jgi:hypothetical protein
MAVAIKPEGTSLNAAAPVLMFAHATAPRAFFSSVFSVATDGRFLVELAPAATATTTTGGAGPAPGATAGVTVILNWAANRSR